MLKKPLPLATLFILTNALYFWMASRTLPALMAFAGGLPPLDALPFGYAPDYPARLFAALGEAGRDYYRAPQLILDSFYPLLFALTYANLLAVLLRKNFPPAALVCLAVRLACLQRRLRLAGKRGDVHHAAPIPGHLSRTGECGQYLRHDENADRFS